LLRSELYELEKVVGAISTETPTGSRPANRKNLTEQVRNVRAICADLQHKWTRQLLSTTKDGLVRRYVQYHEAGIIQLSDQYNRNANAAYLSSLEKSSFSDGISDELERLLDLLRHKFYPYFDIDHKISQYRCHKQCEDLRKHLAELKGKIPAAIDKALVDTVILSVEEMIEDAMHSGISYRQFDHVFGILSVTDQLLHILPGTTTEALARALYKQNFNTLHFQNWYREAFTLKLDRQLDNRERQKLIDEELQRMASVFVNPEKAFETELPSIDRALPAWLSEKKSSQGNAGKAPLKTNGEQNFPLNLSVPQFAMFIRVFSQAGCFPITNVSRITRFFTTHFTTKKQPNISVKSFGRAFYSLDQATAAIIRDHLQRMLNYVDKNYFPKY
jgi:hypothetical protein